MQRKVQENHNIVGSQVIRGCKEPTDLNEPNFSQNSFRMTHFARSKPNIFFILTINSLKLAQKVLKLWGNGWFYTYFRLQSFMNSSKSLKIFSNCPHQTFPTPLSIMERKMNYNHKKKTTFFLLFSSSSLFHLPFIHPIF